MKSTWMMPNNRAISFEGFKNKVAHWLCPRIVHCLPYGGIDSITRCSTRATTVSAPGNSEIAYSDKLVGQEYLELLRARMILLHKGPFACILTIGTTLKAAHLNGKRWNGIDNSDLVIRATIARLEAIVPRPEYEFIDLGEMGSTTR